METLKVEDSKLGSIPIAYELIGEGYPIILVHGWLCNREFWYDLKSITEFNAGYQLILPDLRGHGETPKGKDYGIEVFAEDLKQLVDALELEEFILIGHSMGGLVAQAYYHKYPDGVKLLGLWDTGARIPLGYGIGTLFYLIRIVSFILGLILTYPIPPLFKLVLTQGWKLGFKQKGKSPAYRKFAPSLKQLKRSAVLKAAFALSSFDGRKKLKNIQVPTMLLHGEKDKHITPKQLFVKLQEIPTHEAYTVENAAHFPPNEQPEVVLKHLKEFLGKYHS